MVLKDMFVVLKISHVQHLYLGDFFVPTKNAISAKELLNYTKTELELLVAKQDSFCFEGEESDNSWIRPK